MSTTHHSKLRPVGGDTKSALARALARFRGAFIGVGVFSALINLLALTGSLFMLQVYDRVLPSKSVPTLIGLAFIVLGLYAFQAVLDLIRTRVLVRIGSGFDASLTERVYDSVLKLPLKAPRGPEGLQPIRDLDVIRSFLTSPGPVALVRSSVDPDLSRSLLRLPFLYRPDRDRRRPRHRRSDAAHRGASRAPIRDASRFGAARNAFAELSRRNSEAFHALGMTGRMAARWRAANAEYSGAQQRVSDVTGGLGSIARVLTHAPAVGGARRRRLSRYRAASDGRHHHRQLDSYRPARSLPPISPSPTGRVSALRAKDGIV